MSPSLSVEERFGVLDVITRYATDLDRPTGRSSGPPSPDDCDISYDGLGEWQDLDDFTTYMVEIHARCGNSLHRGGIRPHAAPVM
jgi:hypothetical protein